jgi:long-chain acyl-CoA synthetase
MTQLPPAQGERATERRGAWVFDVDGCLVDSLTGTSLRPGTRDLLSRVGRTHRVFLWSAGGAAYARMRAEQFAFDDLVDDCFAKDGRDDEGHYLTSQLPLDTNRAVFVDDRPEDLATSLAVVAVSPYLVEDRFDRGLDAAQAAAPTVVEGSRHPRGNSQDHRHEAGTERT